MLKQSLVVKNTLYNVIFVSTLRVHAEDFARSLMVTNLEHENLMIMMMKIATVMKI